MCRISFNLGASTSWNPQGLSRPVMGLLYLLPSWHVFTNFGTWSHQCSLRNFIPNSLHMLQRSWAHTLTCLFMYCSFAGIGHADIMCSTVSSDCWHSLHLLSVAVWNILPDLVLLLIHFQSPLNSHRNMYSSPISCLSILLTYWPCITMLCHIFFNDSSNHAFVCYIPFFFLPLFSLDWFNSSVTFATTLIVEFMFGCCFCDF